MTRCLGSWTVLDRRFQEQSYQVLIKQDAARWAGWARTGMI